MQNKKIQEIKILSNKIAKYVYHISDVHIRRFDDNKDEYYKIFQKAKNKIDVKLSIIVVVGDLIDFKDDISLDGYGQLLHFLQTFSEKCPMIIVSGNHDVNKKNESQIDLLSYITSTIKTKNPIFYLRETGLYKYGNIVFSVSSVFDNIVISPSNIDNKYTKICLHHGFVYNENCNVDYMKFHKHKKVDEFNGYDIIMLGDIHQNIYLKDSIAYSGSLIQQNFSENIEGHGFIKWTLTNKKIITEFIEIENDDILMTINVNDGNIDEIDKMNLEKYKDKKIKLRILYIKTSQDKLKEIKTNISLNNIITSFKIEQRYNKEEKNNKKEQEKNICNDKNKLFNLIINEIIKQRGTMTCNEKAIIMKLYGETYDNAIKNMTKQGMNIDIKFQLIKFENVFCYNSVNIIDLSSMPNIYGIIADNAMGKSSIIDIILYALFDSTTKGEVSNDKILNKKSNNYKIELQVEINKIQYIIEKMFKRNDSNKTVILRKYNGKGYDNISLGNVRDVKKQIKDILCITCDQFLLTFYLSNRCNENMLDIDNAKRKEYLFKFVGLDIFDELYSVAEKNKNILKKNIEKHIWEMEDRGNTLKQIEVIDVRNIKEYEEEKLKLSEQINVQMTRLGCVLTDYNINDFKKSYTEFDIKKEQHATKYNDLDIQCEIIDKDIENIMNIKEENEILKLLENHISENIYNKIVREIENNINTTHKTKVLQIINSIYSGTTKSKNITKACTDYYNDIDKMKEILRLTITKNQYTKEMDNLEKEVDQIDSKQIEMQSKINECENDTYESKKVVQIKIDILKTRYDKTILNIDNIKRNISLKEKLLTELKIIKDKISIATSEYNLIEIYEKITGSNGLQGTLAETVCKELENDVNVFLSKFCDLKIEIEMKYGKRTIIEIYMIKDGRIHSQMVSNFERISINLCFKLAFGTAGNLYSNMFMIDEGFESIDKRNYKNLPSLIEYIKLKFKHIFIISHDDKIKDLYNNEIKIVNKENVRKIVTY